MKLKFDFEILELDGEMVAVPVGKNAGDLSAVIKCNETAADILKIMKRDVSEQEIVDDLKEIYDTDEQTLSNAVLTFIALLKKEKLIDE